MTLFTLSQKRVTRVALIHLRTTITLMNRVPFESVSKMLGHANIKTTQHYARIVDMKVGEDMKKLAARMGCQLG